MNKQLAALKRAYIVLSDPNSASTEAIWDEVVSEVRAALDETKLKLTDQEHETNEGRAQRGRNAIDAYIAENGGDNMDNRALRDLLTDLMHMAAIDCESESFDGALLAARCYFVDEKGAAHD